MKNNEKFPDNGIVTIENNQNHQKNPKPCNSSTGLFDAFRNCCEEALSCITDVFFSD